MNVAFDPWIPVVTTLGERKLASLREVITEGEKFADLAVYPHERVSLMRLFLCVSHAALQGPKNYDEWCELPRRLPEAAGKYLTDWKESFELFHPDKPWLQVAKLSALPSDEGDNSKKDSIWSTLDKLCFTRASGNNSTLFDHASNGGPLTEYSAEEIALNLLTFQNYFVAGGKASSRLWGDFEMRNPPNPKGGPCSGKSILFTFLRRENAFDTIHLNLNTYDDLKFLYGDSKDILGQPIWELPIKSPEDKEAITNATKTHLGRLVPQTRILRINKDRKRVLLGAGFLYPKFQNEKNPFYPNLFATVILNKDGKRELLSARPDKSIWRELHGLIVRNKSNVNSNRGPLCLLNTSVTSSCDIVVNAMMTNPKQAAEIVNIFESVFHIPAQLNRPEGIAAYESEIKKSEFWERRLGSAVESYRREIDGNWNRRLEKAKDKWALKAKLNSHATTHYWTAVENNLSHLIAHIESIGTDKAMPNRKVWRKMLYASSCEAYKVACGQETPRQMRAFAKGWQKLTEIQKADKSNPQPTKEDNQ